MHPPLSLRAHPDQLKPRDAARFAKDAGQPLGRWKGMSWPLSFFATEARIVELANDDAPEQGRFYYIDVNDALVRLEFDAQFIQAQARTHGLTLTRDTVDDYIRFALAFTRGRGGRVIPVEEIDQIPLREELTLITKRKLQNLITPLVVEDARTVTGCFLIQDKIFAARAHVDENGVVSLDPTGILADTLPVMAEIFE